ncbi:MAG: sensor histidine kinase [Caulobacterales bacterium]
MRLLLTVSDVTEARRSAALMDDMLREKAVLMQEIQHRVANSLQIIASLLMLNARRVQSDETRDYLYDAHNRVMSVATVQQLLATSALGDVALRPYLTKLAEGLAASMIPDREHLSLKVTSDDSVASADISMSMGLIVTELVINALKHAFPDRRDGRISVDYHAAGPDWTLSVSDDGVGISDPAIAKPGLGTSIVEALSRHLHAKVHIADAHPGAAVTISHVAATERLAV